MEIYVRLGDAGDYRKFGDDFDAVALELVEGGVNPRDMTRFPGGVESGAYCGDNYVSLYWGTPDGYGGSDLVRDLSTDELEILRIAMGKAVA